ncbi:DUF4145 domain-containing protein [Mucilaginibacter daejeonensis]|uniref:DUF4145 domain-containing protein n=1 Tax=Mucilaginibacter daejeonensis TaxID=398049 RepID=UPI001D173EFA|nr:DUF4145 domain-containing protein [Mucilaginibacter daejeonensis]UEG52598.1 DUF4145 domain-containing protein [Mucilaginibacter daejeonensis]
MKNISIYCPFCHRHTAVSPAPTRYTGKYGIVEETPAMWLGDGEWWIGLCNYCQKPMLVHADGDTIYPTPMPTPTDLRIPEGIRLDLEEAKRCFSVSAFRGCAVLARRAIQSTCIDKGTAQRDLVKQIDDLQIRGIITNDLKEWAHVIRWIGNDAAHPNKDVVSEEDAGDILELCDQFLNTIYVAPAIAKERREIRGK